MLAAASSAVLFGSIATSVISVANADEASDIAEGKEIAFSTKLGNCLSCHAIEGGEMPGNIGPPLLAMKARFPDREKLKSQIYDSRVANPTTIMPPFGAHEILTADELEKVVSYIHSL
ncbi:MAG: sulfur oxidation c-type cytochrome SoxX [Gammaproteobacteria bacterium]|nr:sulfur oxidation c-type cytochrome SoxX [Gammaproteobacteria bacterium]